MSEEVNIISKLAMLLFLHFFCRKLKHMEIKLKQDDLLIEVSQIKKMMDLLSNLFSIRTSFIYAIDDDQYTREIAGNNGDYQKFCIIIQEEMKHRCIACDLDKFKESLGDLKNELTEEEILKLRENQDKMAEILFSTWMARINKIVVL